MTLQSTLSLLDYLTSSLHYKYLLTASLGQDKMENVFEILRQPFGCNDHTSPEQYLLIINNLTFYSLAKPPRKGNSSAELISALLQPSNTRKQKAARTAVLVDEVLDEGNLAHAAVVLEEHSTAFDHQSCIAKKSDSQLVFLYGWLCCPKVPQEILVP